MRTNRTYTLTIGRCAGGSSGLEPRLAAVQRAGCTTHAYHTRTESRLHTRLVHRHGRGRGSGGCQRTAGACFRALSRGRGGRCGDSSCSSRCLRGGDVPTVSSASLASPTACPLPLPTMAWPLCTVPLTAVPAARRDGPPASLWPLRRRWRTAPPSPGSGTVVPSRREASNKCTEPYSGTPGRRGWIGDGGDGPRIARCGTTVCVPASLADAPPRVCDSDMASYRAGCGTGLHG